MPGDSLLLLCLLLFADGATLALFTTPLLLAYAPHHAPWTVAVFGGLASALGSVLQLALFRWMLAKDRPWMRRFLPSREKIEATIARVPSASFLAIAVARATPLPDAPIKLAAALVRYPLALYGLAVLLGGAPYYYLLAFVGHRFPIPGWVLMAAIAVILAGVGFDQLRRRRA